MAGLGFRAKRKLPIVGRLYRERDRLRALQARSALAGRTDLREPFLDFLDLVRPRAPAALRKVRIGSRGDGGYVMLDDFDGITRAISAGIGANDDWDVAIAKRGLAVVQLDPTIAAPPSSLPLLAFRRLALAGESRPGVATSLNDLAAEFPGELLVKADIEDSEWPAFAAASPATLRAMRQIVVEFHSTERFGEAEWRAEAFAALRAIAVGHQSFHLHGNNAGGSLVIAGIPFPRIFEVSFVRRDRCDFTDDDQIYPTPVDLPNLPNLAELHLGRIGKGPQTSLPRP